MGLLTDILHFSSNRVASQPLYIVQYSRGSFLPVKWPLYLFLSSWISLCPSFPSRFFTNRESTGIRHPFKTDYFTVNWWCWHRGCERFIKMQAYNFSLDGLSHGFSTIEFRLLSEQSEYPRSQWTSAWTGCVFWIAWMLNCSWIFFSLWNIYRWAKRNFIFLAFTIKEFVNLITIIK